MFEISTLEFEKLQSFMQKNPFEFGAKIVIFGCFRVEFEENILDKLSKENKTAFLLGDFNRLIEL